VDVTVGLLQGVHLVLSGGSGVPAFSGAPKLPRRPAGVHHPDPRGDRKITRIVFKAHDLRAGGQTPAIQRRQART
jgi:hypothetical protein